MSLKETVNTPLSQEELNRPRSHNFVNEIGNTYGRLTVIEIAGKNPQGRFNWLCECSCGNNKILNGSSLRDGIVKSCGCIVREGNQWLSEEDILDRQTKPRKCSKCLRMLPPDQFNQIRNSLWCKECRSSYEKSWRKSKVLGYGIAYKYGLTLDEYGYMLKSQNGLCAICLAPLSRDNGVGVDHDHRFQKGDKVGVRGLLCFSCNKGIGDFRDNPDTLLKAMDYLTFHNKRLDKLI